MQFRAQEEQFPPQEQQDLPVFLSGRMLLMHTYSKATSRITTMISAKLIIDHLPLLFDFNFLRQFLGFFIFLEEQHVSDKADDYSCGSQTQNIDLTVQR